MGDGPRLWKLHREEVGREIRARRFSKTRGAPGHLAAFWREIGQDVARLAGVFGLSVKARKRKGAA